MANNMLSKLKPPQGAVKKRKRVGRGPGSGLGKTGGRGQKGQTSRSGGGVRPGFEGGQMPLQRRLPKRGFTNLFRKKYEIINVGDLERYAVDGVISLEILQNHRRAPKNAGAGLKVLGNGEINTALTVKAQRFSQSAIKKIEAAGGKAEVIDGDR
ncbi:MAG: 50S ribosomal protein L15 [Deltaproteobacteria bacterium]|nr:MAG: 50S ribosomal protein L15 [Deltaproteobacteria bacterium]